VIEGDQVIFSLLTQNIAPGFTLPYTLSGISAADVTGAILTGTVKVDTAGSATITVGTNADKATEGDETLNVVVEGISAAVLLKDTSTEAPTPLLFQPIDGAKSVAVTSNLNIFFDEPIQRGTGAITLKTADGKVVETFAAANATVSGSTLTLNPAADLSIFTKYVVELGAGAVRDLAGNGNANDSRYDFQTATQDGLYHFFVVAFAAAPGATYMGQLAEAVNFGLPLNQIVEIFTTKKHFTYVYPASM
jgi:hypothetical protein